MVNLMFFQRLIHFDLNKVSFVDYSMLGPWWILYTVRGIGSTFVLNLTNALYRIWSLYVDG